MSGQAVALMFKTITWGAADGNTAAPLITEWAANNETLTDPTNYRSSDPRELGEITWTYNYKSVGSDETVLAIYNDTNPEDADYGDQIIADLHVTIDAGTGLRNTAITVKTAYYGREQDGTTIVNSLYGKTWKVLVAKVINNFGAYRTI